MPRHDAQHRFARADRARTVRPGQHHAPVARIAHHIAFDLNHVLRRDAVGDANAIADACIGGLHDAVGGKGWRHEYQRCLGPGGGNRVFDRIKHRDAVDGLPAFAGHNAADNIGPIIHHFLGMKLRHPASNSLHDHAGAAVQKNAHDATLTLLRCA